MSGIDVRDRLPPINYAEPVVDRERAGRALAAHIELLGLAPVTVRWMPDAEEGQLRMERGPQNGEWQRRLHVACLLAENDDIGYASSLGRATLWPLAWRQFEDEARRAAAGQVQSRTLRRHITAPWTAARGVVTALGYLAARSSVKSRHERVLCDRAFKLWAPILEAYAGGLWVYWILHQEIVAVSRPALRTLDGFLHAPDGPAVAWPEGARYYFWRGLQVPERLIVDASWLTAQRILQEGNREIQRAMLERFGYARFILELGAVPVQTDAFGALYRIRAKHREPFALLHVTNSTPEPDGTRKRYFLRVPPTMKTAHEAVAWTFGMRAEEYRPTLET